MGYDYTALVVIALVIEGLIFSRVYIFDVQHSEGHFIRLIEVSMVFSIVDALWGLCYENLFGFGTIGLEVASALFFGMSAIMSFCWFIYVSYLMNYEKMKVYTLILTFLPAGFVIAMCITNYWTQALYIINETCDSYHRGTFYILEQVCTYGYFVVMFVFTIGKALFTKSKDKKRYYIIAVFSVIPCVVGFMQIFTAILPYSSLAYTTAIVVIYLFISEENNKVVLLSESNRQNNQLKEALVTTALAYYEVNVTKNCINGGVNQIYDGEELDVLEMVGLEENCQYTKFLDIWYGYIDEKYYEKYRETFSPDNISKAYKEGIRNIILEYPCRDVKGIKRYVRQAVFLSTDEIDDDIIAFVYMTDLTETIEQRKQIETIEEERALRKELAAALEQAKIASDAKTTFLFNMSHDIRTPMNAIIGFSDLIEKNIDDKEFVSSANKKIKHSSNVLLKLINDVLDLSRIESGKLQLDLSPRSLLKKVEDIEEMFKEGMEGKNINFIVETDIKNDNVYCDDVRIAQIAINLLGNAKKFTPKGGSIYFGLKQITESKDGCADYVMTVKDTGIGMSKEFQTRIFDAFERERTSTVTKIEGTGLGLAIVKRIIDMIGAQITLESKLGEGTTFDIRFTFKLVEEEVSQKAEEADVTYDMRGKRILLVEDNELNLEIAYEILTAEGLLVETAEDGANAIAKVIKSEVGYYDVILMDIQMPVMDGYTATKEIRALSNKGLASIPIVAMTANAFDEDKKMAFEAGMNGHVAKPIDTMELLKTMKEVMPK